MFVPEKLYNCVFGLTQKKACREKSSACREKTKNGGKMKIVS